MKKLLGILLALALLLGCTAAFADPITLTYAEVNPVPATPEENAEKGSVVSDVAWAFKTEAPDKTTAKTSPKSMTPGQPSVVYDLVRKDDRILNIEATVKNAGSTVHKNRAGAAGRYTSPCRSSDRSQYRPCSYSAAY